MTVGMPVKHLKDFLTVHQDRISQPSLREFLLYRVASIFLVDLMAIAATLCEGGGGSKNETEKLLPLQVEAIDPAAG